MSVFLLKVIEMYSDGFSWQHGIIDSGNGLVLNRQQTIIWTNDGQVYWWIYVSLGLDELSHDELK